MLLIQLYFISVGLLALGAYFIFGSGFHEWYVFACSAVSILNTGVFHIAARQLLPQRGLFSCSFLFSISFCIVFFQFPVLAPFYDEIRYNGLLWARDEFVNWTTMISAMSYHLFFVGYLYRLMKTENRKSVRVVVVPPSKLRNLLLIFPVLSIASFLLFVALVGPAYLRGAYAGSVNWGGGASHAFRLFEVFFYLTIGLEINKIKQLKPRANLFEYIFGFNIVTGAFIAFFMFFNLYTGDRGPLLATILILAGGYDFFFRRINFLFAVVSIVFGVMLLSFISDYRSKDASLTVEEKIEKGKEKSEDKAFYEYTGDLAASVRIMNYAAMITENASDYYYGWIQAGRLTTTVPFAAGIFSKLAPFRVHQTPLGSTSSSVFTYHVLGPNSTIGVGTSILADLYIDFGIVGCFAGMYLFGYFIAWGELRAQTHPGIYQVVFFLLLVSSAIYWPRAFIGINFQSWFLSFFCLYMAQKYLLHLPIKKIPSTARLAGRGK